MNEGYAAGERRPLASHPRGLNLAWMLALAYLLVIAYASLQPFSGWWRPPQEIRRFLTAPWPHYITLQDVVLNIGAYVPLGFLLARALMRRLGNAFAAVLAVLLACLTSLVMETAQMFLPSRIPSNVDILTNSIGALIGALAAPLFTPKWLPGRRLARLRRAWFVYGRTADVGLVLLCVWLATQFNPTAQLFGTGDLRSSLALPPWFMHTPQLLFAAEAAVAGLNVLGLGLVAVALTRNRMPRGVVLAALLASALAAKTFTAAAFAKAAGPFAWLTPGVAVGLATAALLLYALARMPRQALWIIAAISFAAAIAVINLAPDNPYQTVPSQLLAGPTHFLSFSSIVRALSDLWPFLAVAYASAAAWEHA